MNLNPPRRVRAALYIASTFATPTVLWASSTGRIDAALTVLLGSYIAIVSGLAAANTAQEN
ncbi:hypothetical protein [Nocardioides sp. InS609-2]|uniref:hypothetical protein n=1 Tax=Nocardioides sp. InS609-2 TaxID=2760705 RepID=UPI0020BDADD2|nr:hypothetical protein [Nocardioides sp. InS609-2]